MICVDWSSGAAYDYIVAVANTRLVGAQIAVFIENINKLYQQNINSRTHLIGYSLGAHVAGFTGSYIKRNGKILNRITGWLPTHIELFTRQNCSNHIIFV